MKKLTTSARRFRAGFTLVELLTVIAIIGILAAMLMPVLAAAKKKAQKMQAQSEITAIVTAIEGYDQDYGRFPVTKAEQAAAGNNDFTTGFSFGAGISGSYSFDNNSNVVAILMDLERYPNGVLTTNYGHVFNPKQVKYLKAKLSDYDPTATPTQTPSGGVDKTGIYRDPWGNPYVISMDLSYDDKCSDIFYCLRSVSQQGGQSGYNGLLNATDPGGNGDHFLFHGKVMVWSAGPDKTYDANKDANAGVNKDNILSWK